MSKAVEELVQSKNVDYSLLYDSFGFHDGIVHYNSRVAEDNRLTDSEYRLLRYVSMMTDSDREID